MKIVSISALALLGAAACGDNAGKAADPCKGVPGTCLAIPADASVEDIQGALIAATPNTTIAFAAGTYAIDRALSLGVSDVTIRGAGMNETILSFATQADGAQGLLVEGADRFTIHDIAFEDAKGDQLKMVGVDGVTVRRVRTEWTGGPKDTNGAYGIYPVQCKHVLVENSVVKGASDSGLYVGQSEDVIVRNNDVQYNVAGIEIENTNRADVYGNTATHNTGGILVFNMPALSQQGGAVRMFRNKVVDNNTENFGAKGTPVSSVPAGSGVVVNSNDDVEIFDNDIAGNKTANIIVSSVYSTGYKDDKAASEFDPYPERINVYGNRLSGGGDSPDGLDLKTLKVALYGLNGSFPDVLFDGYVNKARKEGPQICLRDVSGVVNADGPGGYKNAVKDARPYACDLPKLPAIDLKRG